MTQSDPNSSKGYKRYHFTLVQGDSISLTIQVIAFDTSLIRGGSPLGSKPTFRKTMLFVILGSVFVILGVAFILYRSPTIMSEHKITTTCHYLPLNGTISDKFKPRDCPDHLLGTGKQIYSLAQRAIHWHNGHLLDIE